jgi:hypothetical protein
MTLGISVLDMGLVRWVQARFPRLPTAYSWRQAPVARKENA